MNDKWLDFAIRIQSIAQAGLQYGKDKYDKERYEELRKIAAEMISLKTDISMEKVYDLFCNETGFNVSTQKLIAVQDWRKHNVVNYAYGVVKIFVLCKYESGMFENNIETTEIGFFDKLEIPANLAVEKCTKEQIMMCFEAFENPDYITSFD